MKIKFTSSEIWEWLDALECNFCNDSPDSILQYNMIVNKLKSAEKRSEASRYKIQHIRNAQTKKQRLHDDEIRDSFAKALRESKRA